MTLKGVRKPKSPAILSHEFVIQNHADIVSCVAMVFVLGLMFQISAPIASIFVTLSHNASAFEDLPRDDPVMLYTNGWKDVGAIFFYSLICIVIHAVIQEYILDKITKKLHLSKTKLTNFNEAGQLLVFTTLCATWGINILYKGNVLSGISSLWSGYPGVHAEMTFIQKFFFLIQISYWIHCIPELYFQKIRKEEMMEKLQYPLIMVGLITAAYITNFTRIALVLLVLRFIEEAILHLCRLFHFADKSALAKRGFWIWNIIFVVCRLLSFIATILTFHYGLATLDNQGLDVATGNFNTGIIRFNALLVVCIVQAYMMWLFIHFHLKRKGAKRAQSQPSRKKGPETKSKGKKVKKEKSKPNAEDDVSMLPEADQNTRRRK